MTHKGARVLIADILNEITWTPWLREKVEVRGLELAPTVSVEIHTGTESPEWCVRVLIVGADRFPILLQSHAEWNLVKSFLETEWPAPSPDQCEEPSTTRDQSPSRGHQ